MNRTLTSVLSALILLVAGAAIAADDATGAAPTSPDQVVYDAQSAFAFLKSMAGTWEGQSAKEHDHAGYGRLVEVRTSAAGSAVVQTLFPGQPQEMVNVFHMDGQDLLFTHYCAAQNAPVMKFQKTDVPGEIKFVFNGGTNFDPAVDMHAHEGTFHVKDKDTVGSSFITWAGGQPQPMLEGVMVRKTAG
jgi:hypothetical protein